MCRCVHSIWYIAKMDWELPTHSGRSILRIWSFRSLWKGTKDACVCQCWSGHTDVIASSKVIVSHFTDASLSGNLWLPSKTLAAVSLSLSLSLFNLLKTPSTTRPPSPTQSCSYSLIIVLIFFFYFRCCCWLLERWKSSPIQNGVPADESASTWCNCHCRISLD